MSLISGANFVAPLRSKVQIVGIFALAVLVAVLRLVGAGEHDSEVESSRLRSATAARGSETSLADELDAYRALRNRTKSLKPSGASSGDSEVDAVLAGGGGVRSANGRGQAVSPGDEASQPKKLNEIMRELE